MSEIFNECPVYYHAENDHNNLFILKWFSKSIDAFDAWTKFMNISKLSPIQFNNIPAILSLSLLSPYSSLLPPLLSSLLRPLSSLLSILLTPLLPPRLTPPSSLLPPLLSSLLCPLSSLLPPLHSPHSSLLFALVTPPSSPPSSPPSFLSPHSSLLSI